MKDRQEIEFIAQQWVNDYAVAVIPGFEVKCSIPTSALVGVTQGTYASDHLRYRKDVPIQWQEWSGPFEIVWDD